MNLKIGQSRLSSMGSRKKKEKWKEPQRPVGHHQDTNIHVMEVPEREEREKGGKVDI